MHRPTVSECSEDHTLRTNNRSHSIERTRKLWIGSWEIRFAMVEFVMKLSLISQLKRKQPQTTQTSLTPSSTQPAQC